MPMNSATHSTTGLCALSIGSVSERGGENFPKQILIPSSLHKRKELQKEASSRAMKACVANGRGATLYRFQYEAPNCRHHSSRVQLLGKLLRRLGYRSRQHTE